MRSIALASCISLFLRPILTYSDTIEQSPAQPIPFFEPSLQERPRGLIPAIFKRQNSCQSGYSSCASLSAPNECCPNSTSCARDSAGNIACCPHNYVCTGVLSGSASSQQSGSGSVASSTTNVIIGSTVTVTSTAGVTGTPTTGGGTITAQQPVTITAGSTVPNNFYPFPYIQTTYANSIACLSAYSFCQSQSTSCFTSLAGQNAVTISNALGGSGVTVQGVTGIVQSSASSICSSLSLSGCYGLQSTRCSQFGNGGAAASGLGPNNAGGLPMGLRYCEGGGGGGRYYAAAGAAMAVVGARMVAA